MFLQKKLHAPHLSLDIAYDGKKFYLLEFQCLYFGTAGILFSDEFFTNVNDNWITRENSKDIEQTYVYSIVNFIKINNL